MPLVLGYGRYVDEHVVAGMEVEVRRPLDHQMCDFGRQQQTGTDVRLAVFGTHQREPVEPFAQVQQPGHDQPLPEVRAVDDQQQVKRHVQQMRPIEYLTNGRV